jgi:hypothetical protein
MKSFWYGTLALALMVGTPVKALTVQQVTEKLNSIPAFVIVNAKGDTPTIRIKNDKEDLNIVPVFTDGPLAQTNFAELKKKAPDAIKDLRVIPIFLGKAFEAAHNEGTKKDSKVTFDFQASLKTQQEALNLAKKKDKDVKNFPGIPLFFLGTEGRPLIFTQGDQQQLRFYFSKADIGKLLAELQKNKPELTTKTEIQVASLYNILNFMLDSKNDKDSQSIIFIPDEEAIKFAVAMQKTIPAPAAAATPAAAVPAPPKADPVSPAAPATTPSTLPTKP